MKDIAQAIAVSRQTVKQVLLALKEGGMTFAVSPTKNWQLNQADLIAPTSCDVSILKAASALQSSSPFGVIAAGHSPARRSRKS